MAEDKFKLPGSSYEELTRIIHAYSTFAGDASPSEVGSAAGKHQTIVSRNNGFLVSIGIVVGTGRKRATPEGKALGHALEFAQNEEIGRIWRELCERSDFVRTVVSAVRVRRSMDRPTLIAHIAYTAGQSKSQTTMTGASALVDILLIASLLSEDNGKLTVATVSPKDEGTSVPVGIAQSEESSGPALSFATPGGTYFGPATGLSTFDLGWANVGAAQRAPSGVPMDVRLNLSVQCNPDDLATLAPKIRQFIADLTAPPDKDTSTPDEEAASE